MDGRVDVARSGGKARSFPGDYYSLLHSHFHHTRTNQGAFYIFKKTRKGFTQAQGPVVGGGDNFARTLSLSSDGRVATIGSVSFSGNIGAVWNFVN